MASRAVKKEPSFEEGLSRLDEIAQLMESGELALEELLKLYEEGTLLSAKLNQKLEAAQSRMQEIKAGKDGKPVITAANVVEQVSLMDGMEAGE